jgi:high affinity sulfate transporter 1
MLQTIERRTRELLQPHGGQPLAWTLRDYPRSALRGDLLGGITVAALIVPLSIGYAGVAGLPPEVGLYASLAPLVAYAILGSARRLVLGPDAATAALVGATIAPLALVPADRVALAGALALLVGGVFVAMRLASLGFIADFLSRPILVGYMTGVGITVAVGQIPKLLGTEPLGVLVQRVPDALGGSVNVDAAINLPSIAVGLPVLVAVLLGARFAPSFPVAFVALVVALVASAGLDLAAHGVDVLGPVPSGLPPVGIPWVSAESAVALLPGAVAIALLSFADTALTGRSFSARHGEQTDPGRELVALAAADLAGGVTGGYPISASPSRTSAAEAAGSKTQLAGLVAAGMLVLVLVFLASYLTDLPQPALAAVVLGAAVRFIDVPGMLAIWRLRTSEGAIALAACIGVVLYGTLIGVAVAVALAAVNVVRRAARPRIAELGRIPGTDEFADLARSTRPVVVAGARIVRFEGPLFFANAGALRDRVLGLLDDDPSTRLVVVDCSAVSDVDTSAAEVLVQLVRDLGARGVHLRIAHPTGWVRDLLRRYGVVDALGGPEGMTATIREALDGDADGRDAVRPAASPSRPDPALEGDGGPGDEQVDIDDAAPQELPGPGAADHEERR